MSRLAPPLAASRRAAALAAVLVASLTLTGACAQEGAGPSLTSTADAVVTVRSADGEVVEVEPGGGALVLSDDCLEAPLVVTYADGDEVAFDAPVCPGQELLIEDGSVRLVEPSYQ